MNRARIYQYIEIIKFADRLTGIGLLNGTGKKALDVGCGRGSGLVALKILGYDVYGFDLNLFTFTSLKNRGFKVTVGDVEHGILLMSVST